MALIGACYSYGLKSGYLPKNTTNPATGIEKFREQTRERHLSEAELSRLGEAIREAETLGIPWIKPSKSMHARKLEKRLTNVGPHAAAALRLLIFTGVRLREILDLQWNTSTSNVDYCFCPTPRRAKRRSVFEGYDRNHIRPALGRQKASNLTRGDAPSKPGIKHLGGAACSVLANLPRNGTYVIAGNDPEKPRADLQRPWALVCRRAGLEGVRLHDLRHSFASVGAGSGLGLPIIGKLLGHRNSKTTKRYAHLAADPVRRAADSVSAAIAKAMGETMEDAPV